MTKKRLFRINKFLSDAGICSRRKADEHILRKEVKINGNIAKIGEIVDLETDLVEFAGKIVATKNERKIYALNKPKGVISTTSDEMGRKTLIDYLPKGERIYPAGRLDFDSEGLIILTNDGDFSNLITHPSFEHKKEYEVTISAKTPIDIGKIKKEFLRGLEIDGKVMKAEVINNFKQTESSKKLIITLKLATGYNRQIRKMCAKIGLDVINLKRVKIGKLDLNKLNLGPSEYKIIKPEDII